MDICANEEKELIFVFYASAKDITLSLEDWKAIQLQAEIFFPKALLNEEAWQAKDK